jgi:hypothetical protein
MGGVLFDRATDGQTGGISTGTAICLFRYCMTVPRWKELLGFANDTGLSVAFGVNVMYGQ